MNSVEFTFRAALATVAAIWIGLEPAIQLLLGFMVLDIVSGVLASIAAGRKLDSDTSFPGIAKKGLMLVLVIAGKLGEPHVAGVPMGTWIALFFAAHELLSITENAAVAGLPVPPHIKILLAKLKPEEPAV